MATILLQAAGAALGGLFGIAGKAIGMAAGSLAGYVIDRALVNSTRTIEGARLSGATPITAEEGAPIPRLYGTMRIGGTIVWATRFEEQRQTTRQGIKGGPRIINYRYFGNFAVALCEGEIAGIRRVWADGQELDLTTVEMRVHRGDELQLPDPLIEGKQGAGNTPAYRGTAYAVFERFPLEPYGNRIPQLQFEVMRPVSRLNSQIRAITLIPGATEFGLSSTPVTATPNPGETKSLNRHVLAANSDFAASMDALQALCTNLEHVALVLAWFGDDLRVGQCRIRPCVVDNASAPTSMPWSVSGVTRAAARMVSRVDGKAAFGGTPSDRTVIDAIRDLTARGLKVTLYPFAMMDIAPGNSLPDPYGGSEQAAYPWRGRITADPAPGAAGSPDGTAQIGLDVAGFCGNAQAADFSSVQGGVAYSGDPSDMGYRRFVLHNAALAAAAGGVDAFLIGSELRGLTTLRDDLGRFPFVDALCDLAADVRLMLGTQTAITYGADWSEYAGYRPDNGSGDVLFHLDPLWAHPAVSAVGIDNYMPLTDWRDEDWEGGNPDGARGPSDQAAMTAAIGSGEGFDWYYATAADRLARQRTAITDGAYAKPWVFRSKDIIAWWSNAHYDRSGGSETPTPTAWIPASKPIWFTELGCPAVDKGANRPNVFPDPKSSESAVPYHSGGGRDDLVQARFLAAHFSRWNPSEPADAAQWNPLSPVYGGPMVDPARIYVWAWDARPYPAFPVMADEWGDNANHYSGHWLNGRLEGAPVAAVIDAVLADHHLPPADTALADGFVSGYLVGNPVSAREAIEPVLDAYGLAAFDDGGTLVVRNARGVPAVTVASDDLVADGDQAMIAAARDPDHDLPGECVVAFRDPERDHQSATVRVVEPDGRGRRLESLGLSAALDPGAAEALAADMLRSRWTERNRISFALPPSDRRIAVGSAVRFTDNGPGGDWLVTDIEEGLTRRINARMLDRAPPHPARAKRRSGAKVPSVAGAPLAKFIDLPLVDAGSTAESRLLVAASARPWRPQVVLASPDDEGFEARSSLKSPSTIGLLETPLASGLPGRINRGGLVVRLLGGELQSVSRSTLLNGANLAAIETGEGAWELVQFQSAEETAPDTWRLSSMLRGQAGTTDAMKLGAPAGAALVLLDQSVVPAGLRAGEAGLLLNWRVGPEGTVDPSAFASAAVTGGVRARLHLAPVHLKAVRTDDAIELSWIRCGRIYADRWDGEDIPLDAAAERYRATITGVAGAILWEGDTDRAALSWPLAEVQAVFGAGAAVFTLSVRQVSAENGAGLEAVREFTR